MDRLSQAYAAVREVERLLRLLLRLASARFEHAVKVRFVVEYAAILRLNGLYLGYYGFRDGAFQLAVTAALEAFDRLVHGLAGARAEDRQKPMPPA